MPRLSDSMEEGTIAEWLKADGDYVEAGAPLVDVETDKATMTYEADAAGYLAIVAPNGATVALGQVIARLLAEPAGQAAPAAQDPPRREGAEAPADANGHTATVAVAVPEAGVPADGRRRPISPLATRIAAEHAVELSGVSGSGPGGRVIRADVLRLIEEQKAAASQPADREKPVPARDPSPSDSEIVPASRTQQLIARRMVESKATAPEFSLSTEIEMNAASSLRRQLRDAAETVGGPVPSYNDFIVKACATALREFPRVNGSYRDAGFELHSHVNIGIAVTAEETLVVPTVADADRKSLREIATDSRHLAERVRSGEITPPELSGGTFTISNLGMFGVTEFVAVINPPQAAILAVGKVEERPVVRSGEIVARELMNVTLVCDHRILYGADAAQFLARVKTLLEHPIVLAC